MLEEVENGEEENRDRIKWRGREERQNKNVEKEKLERRRVERKRS
jgi:hypothetical protein